jgi:EAL and modified HD-GYP domain-containing signal transduction protein
MIKGRRSSNSKRPQRHVVAAGKEGTGEAVIGGRILGARRWTPTRMHWRGTPSAPPAPLFTQSVSADSGKSSSQPTLVDTAPGMKSIGQWLSRWRSAPQRPDAPSAPPAARPEEARPPIAATAASTGSQGSWLVTRRPVIDRSGAIAGWDLQLSARASERLARRDTPRVLREAYWFALAQAARESGDGSRRVLVGAPAGSLADSSFIEQLPARTIVRVDRDEALELAAQDLGWSSRIETRGLLLAAPHTAEPPLACAYRLYDAATDGPPGRAHRWRAPANERWVAINLGTYEEVAAAVHNGVEYCCGNFVLAARRPEARQVSPLAINAANILSAIIGGRSTREIADQFKADTSLSHRLLQATRSAALALNRPLESIQEAVMMLGARELYRWLSVLLMSADNRSTIATALHETALTRGRLLELLAQAAGRGDPAEQLFVTGTFSLLDLILNVPLEVALALTPLPTPATEALIGEAGPWWPYLSIALALERDEPDKLERSCAALGVETEVAINLGRTAREWAAQTVVGLRAETRSPELERA